MKNPQALEPSKRFLTLLCALFVATALAVPLDFAAAQEKANPIKTAAPAYTNPVSGGEMYARYCAPCHGIKGQGNGPAAGAFKTQPVNLTVLAKSHGGKFPRMLVSSTLRVGTNNSTDADVHMPVWSDAFRHLDSMQQGAVQLRIKNLTDYVETLQIK